MHAALGVHRDKVNAPLHEVPHNVSTGTSLTQRLQKMAAEAFEAVDKDSNQRVSWDEFKQLYVVCHTATVNALATHSNCVTVVVQWEGSCDGLC